MDFNRFCSTSGHLHILNGAAIFWKSQLQATVADSTSEFEYMPLSDTARSSVSLRFMLDGIKET